MEGDQLEGWVKVKHRVCLVCVQAFCGVLGIEHGAIVEAVRFVSIDTTTEPYTLWGAAGFKLQRQCSICRSNNY